MNFINKINKYLIERYPTIWNTRLVWMLLIGLSLHILFFIVGFLTYVNPIYLQVGSVEDDYFETGMFLVHLIISILLLVGWLVYLFKNNAFKNLYPVKNLQLFGQFLSYFIILFISTSFYFSYTFGAKLYINNTYPDNEFASDIKKVNIGFPFLLIDHRDYAIDNPRFPVEFTENFCETNPQDIDYTKPHFKNRDKIYQFNKINSVTVFEKDEYGDFYYPSDEKTKGAKLLYNAKYSDSAQYFIKGDVVDLSDKINTKDLSIYNFSKVFFYRYLENDSISSDNPNADRNFNQDAIAEPAVDYAGSYEYDYNLKSANSREFKLNKQINEILNRNNKAEINQILNNFLSVSNKFKIKTNLDVTSWEQIVYQPKNFEVKKFITDNKQLNYNSAFDDMSIGYAEDMHANDYQQKVDNSITNYNFYRKNLSDKYIEISKLERTLLNIATFKSHSFFLLPFLIVTYIAFVLSSLLLAYRVTSLKTIIFSGITVGILALIIGLFTLLFGVFLNQIDAITTTSLILLIGTVILVIPILKINLLPKFITSIFMAISIVGFILYVFLILFLIDEIQRFDCYKVIDYTYQNCNSILNDLGFALHIILIVSGFLFIFLYTKVIKKWRALPE